MKYFFPIHLDGGNRGCEAIAKSTAILIGEKPDHLFGYSRDTALDTRLGLGTHLTLIPCRRESYLVDKFLGALNRLLRTRTTSKWRKLYPYRSFLQLITSEDTVISTGGDMLCYDDNEVIYTNDWLHKRHVKTILWGCSMGPENQTPEKLNTLSRFSLIYTRESLTYEYFKSLGLENVCMLPDPAFILPAETCPLPPIFAKGDVIGLNISSYVTGGMTLDSKFGAEVTSLISHILDNTGMNILLVPHVTWKDSLFNQDDREMATLISSRFGQTDRISILDIDDLNYCQIRHVIAHCRLFIGARTHAVISAYAMCVPTIALGYSIKSRGIAKDLGLDERQVVNCKSFSEGSLRQSFAYLLQQEDAIRQQLQSIMPEYSNKPYQIRTFLNG